MGSFRSDNNAGICPEAIEAIRRANDGSHREAYGDDEFTAEAVAAFRSIFGETASVWFVSAGTAANTLAIASLTRPWERIVCHAHSHCNDDESTAPERFTQCRATPIHTDSTKLTPEDISRVGGARGDVHQPQPGVVTVSNCTEFGTVYTPAEMRALCETAHQLSYRVHVDGARFANAVAALGCDPRELTVEAGVDALSFGGTKNGLALGEAVLFFPQGDESDWRRATEAFPFHQKGTGHLLSKQRFVSAPFTHTLRDSIWLEHAGHANAMARRLAEGAAALGATMPFNTEANMVYLSVPPDVEKGLRACGHGFHYFSSPAGEVVRLMCSFDTRPEEVDGLVSDLAGCLRGEGVR